MASVAAAIVGILRIIVKHKGKLLDLKQSALDSASKNALAVINSEATSKVVKDKAHQVLETAFDGFLDPEGLRTQAATAVVSYGIATWKPIKDKEGGQILIGDEPFDMPDDEIIEADGYEISRETTEEDE